MRKGKSKNEKIENKILRKKIPFHKWLCIEDFLSCIMISIVLCSPSIISASLTHQVKLNVFFVSITTTIIWNLIFNIILFERLVDRIIPLLIQVPIGLLCIYISFIINPFLLYALIFLTITIISMVLLFYEYDKDISNRTGLVEKHEIREYKLNKIKNKNKNTNKNKNGFI